MRLTAEAEVTTAKMYPVSVGPRTFITRSMTYHCVESWIIAWPPTHRGLLALDLGACDRQGLGVHPCLSQVCTAVGTAEQSRSIHSQERTTASILA